MERQAGVKPALTKWCLQDVSPTPWSLEEICQAARTLSVEAVEVVSPEDFPTLRKHGLVSALTTSHMFVRGPNNRAHWDECLGALRTGIDANAAYGFDRVITFWGFEDTTNEGGSRVDLEEGKKNLIEAYKKIVGYAEEKGTVICLEPLNTRDATEMKGHPGYQGASIEDCMEVIKAVGSPSLKLLFDFYHVQIMNGDIIRRIGEISEYIGHVQAAGVPGRNELDATQEINFPAVIKALAKNGYRGFVGLEFIPTAQDPMDSLQAAVEAFA
jgi:sugar phosphate isomerase/epimerase